MLAVNHITHFAGVDKQGFTFLFLIFRDEPKGNRNSNAVKELRRQSDNAFYKVGLDNILSDVALAA